MTGGDASAEGPWGRLHGAAGPWVALLHGGPGAPGHMAPVARHLSDRFRVLEPFERRAGGAPLTVAGHVADVAELLERHAATEPAAVVGFSSGAIVALEGC